MCDFSEITEHIFIGNVWSAVDNYKTQEKSSLDILNISVIISALTEYEYNEYQIKPGDFSDKEWHRFVVEDDEDELISSHFHQIYEIINSAVSQNKRVLVHCAAGISRSPTFVIAYLMQEYKLCLEEAFQFVKKRRYGIRPNIGFMNQLKSIENI
jgi:protein-tyrosine phosphatase